MKFATKNPVDLNNIPEFTGEPYVVINDNKPYFKDIDSSGTTLSWESYSDLDNLGRVGVANALIGRDLMPTSKRESIGQVKPSGWQLIRYDDLVNGNYLYNRSHLIAFELAGENANNKNLMTGTRYFNVTGMLPFENSVAQYVKKTNNHVRYRVTPIFVGDELVARGVEMEAYSIEDSGRGVSFNVYVYNNQPGIEINYSDGTSRRK
ncbi:MAG: DNA/RNA non-specific endonuclease [Clostridioides sp.]|nr:DNA/RNA non-specific endonuclease [Clostridioides sp.]